MNDFTKMLDSLGFEVWTKYWLYGKRKHFKVVMINWGSLGSHLSCLLSCFSHIWLFLTLWTVTDQAPPSMGFSRQEYWSGLPCLPPGDLPNLGIEPTSLTPPVLASGFFTTSTTRETLSYNSQSNNFLVLLPCLI